MVVVVRSARRYTTLGTFDTRDDAHFSPPASFNQKPKPTNADFLPSFWQPFLAGAAAAIVHHVVLWFIEELKNTRGMKITDERLWESYKRRIRRVYQDSILPSVSRVAFKCRKVYIRHRKGVSISSISSFLVYCPLLTAIAFTNKGSNHHHYSPGQRACMLVGATAGWAMLSRAFATTTTMDDDDQDDADADDDDDETLDIPKRLLSGSPTTPPRNSTKNNNSSESSHNNNKPERYLELLVHNVSHTDLVLNCDTFATDTNKNGTKGNNDPQDPFALGRPRFSCFDMYSRKILETVITRPSGEPLEIIRSPRYQRSLDSPRLPIQDEPTSFPMTPIGFRLPKEVAVENWHDLRLRGKDQAKLFGSDHDDGHDDDGKEEKAQGSINQVFFPLLATLLPRWQQQIAAKAYPSGKPMQRVLVLVTGVGTPRNWTHSMTGNSTQAAADLMRVFLHHVDPFLTVVQVHSSTNIFRYDENLLFVERELLPAIEAYRDAHARGLPYPTDLTVFRQKNMTLAARQHYDKEHPFNLDWQKSFAITLSFADGSPARSHAIQASLRPYRPAYFHFWQLKTFWHESKIVDDDIEALTFESMDNDPPMDASQCTDPWVNLIVDEMKAFLTETIQSRRDNFWLRKSQKGVLSVLLVQTPEMKEPVLYRGTNMEVSMPTGSLCAERCVIGSALARNPALKREDLKLIAVLAIPQEERYEASGLRRVQSTSTMASFYDRHPSIGSEFEPSESLPGSRKPSVGSEHDGEGDWVIPGGGEGDTAPVRRIPLFSSSQVVKRSSKQPKQQQPKQQQRTVVVHSRRDLNPLAPCGTCNEWIKKIAEANPYFRIVTFTDANCNGLYVRRCQE